MVILTCTAQNNLSCRKGYEGQQLSFRRKPNNGLKRPAGLFRRRSAELAIFAQSTLVFSAFLATDDLSRTIGTQFALRERIEMRRLASGFPD
jgi:hypothetical protein